MVLAGCTSERGGGSDDGGGTGGTPAAAPTGTPLLIGYVTQENSALGSFPETRVAANAAAAYANAELNGVKGRPIKLVTCATNGSPESSQDCANKLVAQKPVAVVGGIDIAAETAMKIYETAGIPYVSGSPQLNGELNSPNSYSLAGGTVAELLGITDYLTSVKKVRSVHALYVDLPGLLTIAINSAKSILTAKGVTDVKLVAEKADAADFAPALSNVASGNPDAIVVIFQAQACARIVQAASALNIQAPMYLIGSCASPAVAKAAGGQTDNLIFASGYQPVTDDDKDPVAAAFAERVPADQRTSGSEGSFSAVLVVRDLLEELADPTPAALITALKATKDHPNVLAHPFTCDNQQVPLLPSICNASVRLLTWNGKGFADLTGDWLNGSQLVNLTTGG
ncbi:ABC transporter substrate-binding protein [Frankia sp. CNm7]|uniref:ABC transporter substrate-binding protein n=2 Tax=Frankia nepalensis TaxID=1836974 RepID=A0A937R949_9ACTN|nr:ABC transporter substrate-binding protein [Frankia nepalensis]MBL7516326.1 ABC transporter substrate-binding protein [Frankia nepalensis]MBL7519311.1 ABC transporter substrate-binding protein [Frankia nepalensis]MBL7627963.1 ABC transporter substrate-binding protein [Frankia nepalensis]